MQSFRTAVGILSLAGRNLLPLFDRTTTVPRNDPRYAIFKLTEENIQATLEFLEQADAEFAGGNDCEAPKRCVATEGDYVTRAELEVNGGLFMYGPRLWTRCRRASCGRFRGDVGASHNPGPLTGTA